MKEGMKELPEDHWFEVMSRIKEKFGGEKPSPMEVRAAVLLDLAGIPSGQYSALKTDEEGKRTDPAGDRSIAEYLTNPAGLILSGTKGITTRDLRDRYPDGLPDEILRTLDEKTQKIIGIMYKYDHYARENFPDTQEDNEAQKPIILHFLPGGAPLFLVGYTHNKTWQHNYGYYVKEIGKEAGVVAIEGFTDKPFAQSLDARWSDSNPKIQTNDYSAFIKNLVESGYSGLFTEVDGRDISRVNLEGVESLFRIYFLDLPDSFYEKYLAYLKKEHPKFGAHIATAKKLKSFLSDQSTNKELGISRADRESSASSYRDGKRYYSHPALSDSGKVSLMLTGNELGQMIYTDALAAIKLHLLGRMMNEEHIPKGVIVDYEGTNHLSSKSFFLQYPEYAMEIVLRTISELLAGHAEQGSSNTESAELHSQRVFEHTDWEQVIREIFRIPFKKIAEPVPGRDSVEIGENQRPMVDTHPDGYALDTILASKKEGKRSVEDWAKIMEESIKKFAF